MAPRHRASHIAYHRIRKDEGNHPRRYNLCRPLSGSFCNSQSKLKRNESSLRIKEKYNILFFITKTTRCKNPIGDRNYCVTCSTFLWIDSYRSANQSSSHPQKTHEMEFSSLAVSDHYLRYLAKAA